MRRVWASVVAVWATLAIVAGLAWTRPTPVQPVAQPAATTLVVKSPNGGTKRFVVVGATAATAPHATTHASPPPP